MDSTGFLDMKPCRVAEIYRLFGVTSCLPSSSVFYIEDGGRQHIPPKRRCIFTDKDLNIPESNIQIKKNEMGETCSTTRETLGAYRVLSGKAERERNYLEDPGVDGRLVLKCRIIKKFGLGGMDWIYLAKDRKRCRVLVTAVMNVRVPKTAWNLGYGFIMGLLRPA